MISVDSYGWIEMFTDGPKSAAYRKIIDSTTDDEIVTSTITLYEVYWKLKVARGEDIALERLASLGRTKVIPVDMTLSTEASDFSLDNGLHLADAVIYATARQWGAKLYTSDEHLRGLDGVTYI